MTRVVLARESAHRTAPRLVEIEPRRGVRVGEAMRKLREQDAERISAPHQQHYSEFWRRSQAAPPDDL